MLCALAIVPENALAAPGSRLAAFESQLETHASATKVLQAWCDAHAPGTRIVARQVQRGPVPPPPDVRRALALAPGEAVRYRRVQLACGSRVLSNADNWYLPRRLTGTMNAVLEHSQTPFGVAVAPLHFRRHNLKTVFLPPGGRNVLHHSAVLVTEGGVPFSFVVETYTRAILGD